MNSQRIEEKRLFQDEERDVQQVRFAVVTSSFLELFELLEDYAPVWYSEEHHKRAVAALLILQKA